MTTRFLNPAHGARRPAGAFHPLLAMFLLLAPLAGVAAAAPREAVCKHLT